MSNPQQDYLNQAQENLDRAREALNTTESLPDFALAAQVDQETRQPEPDHITRPYTVEAEVEDLPDHVQTAKAEEAVTTTVDVDAVMKKVSTAGQVCLKAFLDYIPQMAPGVPHDETKDGPRIQKSLWEAINLMFNRLPDEDFPIIYRAVLSLFKEHENGAFKDDLVYRYAEFWLMPDHDRTAFRRLLNLMLVTCDPRERFQAARQLNWQYVLEYGLTDIGRNRIRNFYEL